MDHSDEFVLGRNFKVPVTQDIHFVELGKFDPTTFAAFPRKVDLRDIQSEVKSQGARGACTYFVITSLVESLIKKSIGKVPKGISYFSGFSMTSGSIISQCKEFLILK